MEYLLSPTLTKGRAEREQLDNSAGSHGFNRDQETSECECKSRGSPVEGSKVAPEPLEGRLPTGISSWLPLA